MNVTLNNSASFVAKLFAAATMIAMVAGMGQTSEAQTTSYSVAVKTGSRSGAGTDSNIYLTIRGTRGVTNRIRLNRYGSGDVFEAGNTDVFNLSLRDFGPARYLELENSADYTIGNDWFVNQIEVTYIPPQHLVHFDNALAQFTSSRDATAYTTKLNELRKKYATITTFPVKEWVIGDERHSDGNQEQPGMWLAPGKRPVFRR